MKEISLHILDIVQNSIRAKATEISIEIEESEAKNLYIIRISDNGNGISKEMLNKVTDPYVTSRTRRKMGLGLPLLKYHAELTGGTIEISSEEGKGTRVEAGFSFNHIDRQPLGDITGVIIILVAANPSLDIIYRHKTDRGEFSFSSRETREYLEVENLSDRELLKDLAVMIHENLEEIRVSGLRIREKV
jgi:hypothetical protein